MREFLYRDAPGLELRFAGEGRTIHGLAVPYGQTTTVSDSPTGAPYEERFVRGAFARSIDQRADKVKLLVNHQMRERLPIGRSMRLEETDAGLEVEFLVANTRDGDEALALVRDGVVDGFSVGFAPVKHHRTKDGVLERTEAALREVSLTAFPAYAGATVAGVRSESELDEVRARLGLTLTRFNLS